MNGALLTSVEKPELVGWTNPKGYMYGTRVDSALGGTTAQIDIHAYDVYGNVTKTSNAVTFPIR